MLRCKHGCGHGRDMKMALWSRRMWERGDLISLSPEEEFPGKKS